MAVGFTDYKAYVQIRDENKPCTNYYNYVFKVVPKLNYEVRKELQKKKKYYNKMKEDYQNFEGKTINVEKILKKYCATNKKGIKDKLNDLQTDIELYEKRTLVEEKLNATYYKSKEYTSVKYGDLIQLIHYDSNYYLSAKKTLAAEYDKSCLMVTLDESGSFQSIWKIQASVNHKKQGDIVRYSESVLLINDFNGCYLHSSGVISEKKYYPKLHELKRIKEKSPDRKAYYQSHYKLYEVNSSKNKKEWTLELYRTCYEDDDQMLRCGDTVMLKHTALNGYICADIYSNDLKELNEGNKACYLRIYKGDEFVENYDTGTYFVLERGYSISEQSASYENGGIAKYTFSKETYNKYRLRHLNSGRYVRMAEVDIIFKNKKKPDKQERILGLSKSFELDVGKENNDLKEFDDHTVFQFFSTSKELLRPVKVNSYVKIKYFKVKSAGAVGNKMWVGVGNKEILKSKDQINPSDMRVENYEFFNRIDDETMGLEKRTILLTESDKDENSFLIERVPFWLADTVKYIHSSLGLIDYFVNQIKSGQQLILSNYSDEVKFVLVQMKNILGWIDGSYRTYNSQENKLDKGRVLQKIARDLRLIDLLVDIIYYPFEVFKDEITYDNIYEKTILIEIQKTAYTIIKSIFYNYTKNELYAAQWIKLFIHQALRCDDRNTIYADDTLAYLIRSNKKLLDKYINEEIIESLIDPENKRKNVRLLSSLCVCKGEAVKSKQNKIIDLFIAKESVFKEFFLRMDDIAVLGKGNIRIEHKGRPLKPADFEYLLSSISLVSALCYDRNYKSIEQFLNVYQFYGVFTNFIERYEISYDLKSKFVTLTQHLIFDKEPYKYINYPVYIVDYPPVYSSEMDSEMSSGEIVKLMKKFLNTFLNEKVIYSNYDEMMLSVMNIIFFMCSHKIYGKQEITQIIKIINDRYYDQMSQACGMLSKESDDNMLEEVDDGPNWYQDTYVMIKEIILNINIQFFDDSYDMSLFASSDLTMTMNSKDNNKMNRLLGYINSITPSLNKSLKIINYVGMSRINDAILKFLTKCNTKYLGIENDFILSHQLLCQLGIMPNVQYYNIMREYLIMSKDNAIILDENILKKIDKKLLLNTHLGDFTKFIQNEQNQILNTYNVNVKDYISTCENYLDKVCNVDYNTYEKVILPIQWIKDLVSDNSIFEEKSNEKRNYLIFLELLMSYICSDNYELYINTYKLLIDNIFSIDTCISTLGEMQLIDNEGLRDLHKRIDVINSSLVNKMDSMSECRNEDDYMIQAIYIAKLFFYLCYFCIEDNTEYDNDSNLNTIDRTGYNNVDCMFEKLYSQGLLDNDMEMNKVEEEMVMLLKQWYSDADKEELVNFKKWKYIIMPHYYTINKELQLMFFNLKLQDIAVNYINIDTTDMDEYYRHIVNTIKSIAYRFLFLLSHNNDTILESFQEMLPLISNDLKTNLIAGQLYAEIVSNSFSQLIKIDHNDLNKICYLISTYSEDSDYEKAIGLSLLRKFIYYKNEVIKNNQNEISNLINHDKGHNLIPHSLKKATDKANDNIPSYYVDEMGKIVSELEKNNSYIMKPFICYTQEFIRLLCALTEKSNFYTETQVKDITSFNKVLSLMEYSINCYDMQRKVLQLIIDAFLDLEKVEDSQMIDFTTISSILKILYAEVSVIITIIKDKKYTKEYIYELIPNGVKTKYKVSDQASKYLYNQVVYLICLLSDNFSEKIYDNSDFKRIIEMISDLGPPDAIYKSQILNFYLFTIYIKKYSKSLKKEITQFMEDNQVYIDKLSQYIEEQDSYELMRNNYLLYKWHGDKEVKSFGIVNNFIKIIMSFIKANMVYKIMSIENLKNYCYFLQSQTLKFSNKKVFMKKFVTILIQYNNHIGHTYIIRGLKLLRMFIECFNMKNASESIYWQTKDYITIEGEISDSQDFLIEVGAAELVVKLISNYTNTEIIGESLLLACALLLGGNENTQMEFYKLYETYDSYMLKLFGLMNSSFNTIYHTEMGKLNNNRNHSERVEEKLKDIPFISQDIIKDEQADKFSLVNNYTCKNFAKLKTNNYYIHEVDDSSSNFYGFKNNYLNNEELDHKEIIFRILKFLQNLCENHNSSLQEFVQIQKIKGNTGSKSRNFITFLCLMFKQYQNFICKDMIWLGIQIVDTLVEFIQGPCKSNQIQVVKEKGLDTARDVLYILRKDEDIKLRGFYSDDDQMYISILKYKTIVLINSLFEGSKNDIDFKIYDEIPKSIEFEILKSRLVESYCNFLYKYIISDESKNEREIICICANKSMNCDECKRDKSRRNEWIFSLKDLRENEIALKTEWMTDYYLQEGFNLSIMMMNISDYNKEFKQTMQNNMNDEDIKRAYNFFKLNISNIDVNVFDQIWRVYFPIHPYCRHLSKNSKEFFVNNVDRETPMSKLNGLVDESKFLLYEMQQQYKFNQNIFYPSPEVLKYLSKSLLTIAFIQNIMFLLFTNKTKCTEVSECVDTFSKLNYPDTSIFECNMRPDKFPEYGYCRQIGQDQEWYVNVEYSNRALYTTINKMLGMFQILFSVIIFIVWYLNNSMLIMFRYWQNLKNIHNYECEKLFKSENIDEEIVKDFFEKKNENIQNSFYKQKTVLYLKGPESIEFISGNNKQERNYISFNLTILKYYHDIYSMVANIHFLYYFLYIVLSILGTFVSSFFFIFHLYDLVQRYRELKNILYAITRNVEMLSLTLVLTTVVVYAMSLFSFVYFRDSYYFVIQVTEDEILNGRPNDFCNSIPVCLLYNLNMGIRLVGNHLDTHSIYTDNFGFRLFYDIIFIIVVPIVLINIVFGIVIDSFGELYEQNNRLKDDISNICFICELERDTLEKQGISFDQHISYDHNWEFYLYFIVHLREKDKAFFNGIELEISNMIDKGDVGFFPRRKMFDLNLDEDEEEDEVSKFCVSMLEITQTIKSDIRKINETMDAKISGTR